MEDSSRSRGPPASIVCGRPLSQRCLRCGLLLSLVSDPFVVQPAPVVGPADVPPVVLVFRAMSAAGTSEVRTCLYFRNSGLRP
eukprot:10932018-Heterocapsa_arctica.AAC.1